MGTKLSDICNVFEYFKPKRRIVMHLVLTAVQNLSLRSLGLIECF